MITSFSYTNAKGETATRICNVVHESETELRGFDYNKLNQSEQEIVNKAYNPMRKPTPVPTVKASKMTAADYEELGISKDIFVKAYRIFKKSNMK